MMLILLGLVTVCLVTGAQADGDGESFTVTYAENGANLRQIGSVRQDDTLINRNQAKATPLFTFQPFEVYKKIGKTGKYAPAGFAQVSIDSPTDIPLYLPLDNQFNINRPSPTPSHSPTLNQFQSHLPSLSNSPTVNQFQSHSPSSSHSPAVNQFQSHSPSSSHSPTVNQFQSHSPTSKNLPPHFATQYQHHRSGTANNVYRLPSNHNQLSVYDAVFSKINQPNLLPPINHPEIKEFLKLHPGAPHPRFDSHHPRIDSHHPRIDSHHPSVEAADSRFNEVHADKTSSKERFNLESSYFIANISKNKKEKINEGKKFSHGQLELRKFPSKEFFKNKEMELSEMSRNVEIVSDHKVMSTHAQPFPGRKYSPTQPRKLPADFKTFDAVP